MESLSAVWLFPAILIAGALQAWGPPMNGALRNSLHNPWLASLVSFSSDRSCAGRFGDVFATTFADGRWPERNAVVGAFGRSRRSVCRNCRASLCQ
jgi:Putative inner membrane exporter, YdcZ